jgi:hypothetical protein
MDADWTDGVDLTRREPLERLARETGVSDAGIARATEERAFGPVVDGLTQQALRIGATGRQRSCWRAGCW